MLNEFRMILLASIRIFTSFVFGGGVGLVALGVCSFVEPQRWTANHFQTEQPPMGHLLFSIGLGLLATSLMLIGFFKGGGCLAAKPGANKSAGEPATARAMNTSATSNRELQATSSVGALN